ncbi:MAG: hypothetical protein EOM05_00495 [Clostridia bacterium]|nr:hypothetical protein [Clostridia bacterium]
MEINAYNVSSVSGTGSAYTQSDDDSGLGVNDFMNMLVAQLSNQDVMNPSQDTEFITQMAQFTSLKAMQSIADLSQTQYAASIVGKNVIVAAYDKSGKFTQDTGSVDRVKFVDGRSVVTVNGVDYELSSIMEVLSDSASTDSGSDTAAENNENQG